MNITQTPVPRALDLKTKVFGFELPDLLIIFVYLTVSNLLLGSTSLKIPVVWTGTLVVAALLYFLKRGKPDAYLEHSAQFCLQPRVFTAGQPDLWVHPYAPLDIRMSYDE